MNEVLGTTAGNAVEMAESVRFLRNEQREARLDEVVLSLVGEMLLVGGLAGDRAEALEKAEHAVSSGQAAEVFDRMVVALGGPPAFTENYESHLPAAKVQRAVHAKGFLAAVDARAVGNAIIELGGGRRKVGEALDLSVGFTDIAPIGAELDAHRPLAVVHAASEDDAKCAEQNLLAACELTEQAPDKRPVILQHL
jgi:thymidine phosphorylase